jgi:hypothetical protein
MPTACSNIREAFNLIDLNKMNGLLQETLKPIQKLYLVYLMAFRYPKFFISID